MYGEVCAQTTSPTMRNWGLLGRAILWCPQADPVPRVHVLWRIERLFAILLLRILWRSKELVHKTLIIWSRIYSFNF